MAGSQGKKNIFLNVSKVTSKTSSTLFCHPFIAASNFSEGGSGCHGSRNLQNWPGFPSLPRRDCSVETEAPREKTPNLLLVPPPHRRVHRMWCRRESDFERIAVGAFGAWLSASHRKFERCAAHWFFLVPALGEIQKNTCTCWWKQSLEEPSLEARLPIQCCVPCSYAIHKTCPVQKAFDRHSETRWVLEAAEEICGATI